MSHETDSPAKLNEVASRSHNVGKPHSDQVEVYLDDKVLSAHLTKAQKNGNYHHPLSVTQWENKYFVEIEKEAMPALLPKVALILIPPVPPNPQT